MSTPLAELPGTAAAPYQIRPIRDADLPRVMEIENQSFSTPWKESTFRGLIKRTDTDVLVAEDERGVLGYAAAWTVIDQAELGNVAVDPRARGTGVGGALVDAVVEHVRARGGREIFLEVRETNHSAQSIYRHRGFDVVGRRRSYYSLPKEDALVMRLQIQSFP